MVTTVGLEPSFAGLLRDLVYLDFDAIDAYDAAIARLEDPEYRRVLAEFRDDHRRHTVEVGALLASLGEDVPTGGDAKALLTTGKVQFASLMGDRAILLAMRTNETDTNTAYERAVAHEAVTPEAQALFERNLADERRHREWIDQATGVMPGTSASA